MTRQHDLWVNNERLDRSFRDAVKEIADLKAEIAVLREMNARLTRERDQAEQGIANLLDAGRRLVAAADPVIEALS